VRLVLTLVSHRAGVVGSICSKSPTISVSFRADPPWEGVADHLGGVVRSNHTATGRFGAVRRRREADGEVGGGDMVRLRLTVVPRGGGRVRRTVLLGDEIALVAAVREDDVVDCTVSVPVDDPDDENMTLVRHEVAQVMESIAYALREAQPEEEW